MGQKLTADSLKKEIAFICGGGALGRNFLL